MICWRLLLSLLLCGAVLSSRAGTLAQFRTVFGDIEVELYDAQKPATVNNFKKLINSGAYQDTFFHRLVPGFVVQGGGYFAYDAGATDGFCPPWGLVGSVPHFGRVTNEFGVGPLLSNTNGTLAMAKLGGDPNSATSEFFFSLANNAADLDNQNGGFTVFGRVIKDVGGVLSFFNQLNAGYGLVSMAWWYPEDAAATNLFKLLPVKYAGFVAPRIQDLVFVDVSLLQVSVTRAEGKSLIGWNSAASMTNIVEFTTNMPPVWRTLVKTNGTGSRLVVADSGATNKFRFYRVRVE